MKVEAELKKCKTDHDSATKVIVDLEVRLKEKSEEYDRGLIEKEKEMELLRSELLSGDTMKQSSERMKDRACRLESQLDETKVQNEELSDKVKDLEKRLERTERAAMKTDDDIERLESSALESESREKDLKRRLEKEQRELERQRERFENYDASCATEQETVATLERAIEDLESAHNDSSGEIIRLQKENRSLSTTLAEAEEYMKMYQKDMKESRNLKSMLGELKDINSDLGQQLQTKDHQVRNLQGRIASIEIQVESSSSSSKQAILQLENLLTQKEDDISILQAEISSKRDSHDDEEITSMKLVELTTLFEENEAELEQLRMNKGRMLRTISKLEQELEKLKKREAKSSHALGAKLDQECQVEKSQKEATRAWIRVDELEESLTTLQQKLRASEHQANNVPQAEDQKSELSSAREKLAQRDEQLADSRTGINEAQKMIFRLMNTVQELRKKAREQEQEQSQYVAYE